MQAVMINEGRLVAREEYAEYLAAVRANPAKKDYRILKDAYRELSRGRSVIDLSATLARGGVDEKNRPRLAVSRADRQWCYFFYRDHWRQPTRAVFAPIRKYDAKRRANVGLSFRPDLFGASQAQQSDFKECRAMLPMIPPSLMPNARSLGEYFILWEAVWENLPPVDPMLLRPISRSLYVVVAQWDLTELERAVLAESVIG